MSKGDLGRSWGGLEGVFGRFYVILGGSCGGFEGSWGGLGLKMSQNVLKMGPR